MSQQEADLQFLQCFVLNGKAIAVPAWNIANNWNKRQTSHRTNIPYLTFHPPSRWKRVIMSFIILFSACPTHHPLLLQISSEAITHTHVNITIGVRRSIVQYKKRTFGVFLLSHTTLAVFLRIEYDEDFTCHRYSSSHVFFRKGTSKFFGSAHCGKVVLGK